jgi:histidine phosphotransfer protein HptB
MPPPAIDPDVIGNLQALDPDDDGFFREVVTTFLANTADQIATLVQACAANETQLVERTAHKLKGGCSAIGAIRLSSLCGELERQARAGTPPLTAESTAEIVAEFGRSRVELEAMLGG